MPAEVGTVEIGEVARQCPNEEHHPEYTDPLQEGGTLDEVAENSAEFRLNRLLLGLTEWLVDASEGLSLVGRKPF